VSAERVGPLELHQPLHLPPATEERGNVKEHPILFSAPMVQAILGGRKTQTRRVAETLLDGETTSDGVTTAGYEVDHRKGWGRVNAGDRLWVRETWSTDGSRAGEVYPCPGVWFRADFNAYDDPVSGCYCESTNVTQCLSCWREEFGFKWRPSIFMPRGLSRISIEVKGVRAERLQAISREDALAEGIYEHESGGPPWNLGWSAKSPSDPTLTSGDIYSAVGAYRSLWDSINGKRPGCSWSDNPWVWVVSFKRVDSNARAAE